NNAHRNTIIYRINKMEELLFSDFSDGETRTELQVALYIKNLLEKNMFV
ncbi:MAG: helix-turn-helix domain-containing protein, partial [Treponema sp.]|nr:helix-turn-helix domain-containing protein [Treponema sp.]